MPGNPAASRPGCHCRQGLGHSPAPRLGSGCCSLGLQPTRLSGSQAAQAEWDLPSCAWVMGDRPNLGKLAALAENGGRMHIQHLPQREAQTSHLLPTDTEQGGHLKMPAEPQAHQGLQQRPAPRPLVPAGQGAGPRLPHTRGQHTARFQLTAHCRPPGHVQAAHFQGDTRPNPHPQNRGLGLLCATGYSHVLCHQKSHSQIHSGGS